MDEQLLNDLRERPHYYEHTERLSEHLTEFFKSEEITVFHEMLSPDFHLDVFLINRAEDDFKMLVTSGMSLLEMNVPDEAEDKDDVAFAELMILLPKDIDFGNVHTGNERNGWIISMLKETARLTHHNNTWIEIGHTLQATADLETYGPDTSFVGCAILPSVTFGEDFTTFYCNDRKINIYSVFPLYESELQYKIANGYNGFIELLIEADANEVLDPGRASLI